MRNAKRAAAALTLAAAALAVAGPAHADEAREGGQINLPDDPREVVEGLQTGLDVAAMAWKTAAQAG
ncbi:hypothetical protein AB0Q95_04660 [Streptomyces sp. NPDC059900]|uniref:hypothetical protein n=1 Tax=Streptomyces sp. NPDC059900 TaxID=3155816 RepID=UPI00342F53E7